MSISRRKFLRSGTLVALSAAIPLQHVLGQERTQPDPLAHYRASTFKSYVNSIFRVFTERSSVDLTLQRVKDLPAPVKNGESFQLFLVGGDKALEQNSYTVEHAALGRFKLFIVPSG